MAFENITRVGNTHEKKGVCQMVFTVEPANYSEVDAAGNYLVGYLPNQAIINDAMVFTSVISDSGAVTVGTTEGGTEILSAGTTIAVGDAGTFTGKTDTGTGKPVYVALGAPVTVGTFHVVIEYIEYTLNTGDLTKIG